LQKSGYINSNDTTGVHFYEPKSQQNITVYTSVDGIWPDIIDAATKILDKVGCNFNYEYPTRLNGLENHGELFTA